MENVMLLHSETKLSDLLAAYPWLREALPQISEAFRLLQTPLGKVMAGRATLGEMSRRAGLSEAELTQRLQALIAAHTA